MTKINPLSITIEGLDLKLGNIEPFVQQQKNKELKLIRSQITLYISDYISERVLGKALTSKAKIASYTTPDAAPDGQIDVDEFFQRTNIKVNQSKVLQDTIPNQATFETKAGQTEGLSFTAIDVGAQTKAAGFQKIQEKIDLGKKTIGGFEAYEFLSQTPELRDDFIRLRATLTEKMENLLLVKYVDFDKGKKAELTFVPNPLKEVNLRSPQSFNKYISLSIKPRYKKKKDKQGNVVARRISAYRIEVKAKAPLIKSFESKKITDKIIKGQGAAFSTGFQKFAFSKIEKFAREADKRPSNEKVRQLAAFTVALAREFEAGGQTPLTSVIRIRTPNLNVKNGDLGVLPIDTKRKKQRFISSVQLTQLVQNRLGKTMRKFGNPQTPDLTERSGRFRTSVEVIANYRKSIIAYRYNPIYDNLDKFGYKPSEQVGKATREVVQSLFARAFNIVKS